MAQVSDYTGRIIPEHAGQPDFMALVAAIVQPYVDQQNLYASLLGLFDLDTAVGAQLDIIGLWVGVSRILAVPLEGVFFAFDTGGVGWDQGNWQGPYESGDTLYSLGDDDYRLLLYAKIAANHWTGKPLSTYAVLAMAFARYGYTFLIQDNQDMTIDVIVIGPPLSAVVASLMLGGAFTLRGSGVGIRGYFMPSAEDAPLFGFDAETSVLSGWDVGAWVEPLTLPT